MADTRLGIALMLAGATSLAISDALAKFLGSSYPPLQLLFMRAMLGLPVAATLVLATLGPQGLRSVNIRLHLGRGAVNVGSAVCFYAAVTRIALAEATAIAFCAPLIVTAVAAVLYRERVTAGAWLATLAGFAGVLVIVKPGSQGLNWAMLLPLGTAICYALLMLSARHIKAGEHMFTMMFYIVAAQALWSALPQWWIWRPVAVQDVPTLLGLALTSTVGLGCLTQAFRVAPASIIAPFDYCALIWATLLGWWFWHEVPAPTFYAGALLIVAAGIYMATRKTPGAPRRSQAHDQ
ncbi:DMT family transporter [Lampropedia cohaerens]|uniref:DMT family transporter n=1 Tax=Lampropedia cohaerens TaxID=1610491 RepID=UPI001E349DDE|nr:DMT family transporter [Lampropedia cohaerens]